MVDPVPMPAVAAWALARIHLVDAYKFFLGGENVERISLGDEAVGAFVLGVGHVGDGMLLACRIFHGCRSCLYLSGLYG